MVITEGKPVVFVFRYMRYLEIINKRISHLPLCLPVDLPSILSLMRPDDGEQVVSLKEITRSLITLKVTPESAMKPNDKFRSKILQAAVNLPEEIRTATDVIMNKAFG
jgi:hypothetical protein